LCGSLRFKKDLDRSTPCLICPLTHVFCTERCYFSFVPVVSLQRRVRINYQLPLAFIVAQYLLLARYRARASMKLSGPCVLVFLCLWGQRANPRTEFRGLKDWRPGNRRKGWLHAILRVDGRRLCSILVRSPPSRVLNCRRLLKYVRKLPDRSESIHIRVKAADFPCQTQFSNTTDS